MIFKPLDDASMMFGVLWGWMMRMHGDEKNKKNDMKSANQVGMSVAFHE
jgi:hypothetical protein